MKKILSFLFVIIGLYGYSQDEYYRIVDWKFYPENVIQLTDSTYLTDAYPFDYNDVGAIQRVVGNYVVDFVGHRYSVIDSTSTTITVLDIYHLGQAPQTGQIARCYRSVGGGEAEYIGSIDYSPLDESARWKLNGSDNELLWRQTIGKAENGLYKELRTAKLGGDLTEPTTINQADNLLKILNNGHGSVFSETGIAYTKIDTVDFTDSTLVTKMYVKSLIKEGTNHDSLTIAAGSTGYFEVNYPQIFSGEKLIDSLGVMNTKITGKEPLLTKGDLTAGSSKVAIGGTGTNALIGTGASIDVNEANIVHQNISGHGTNTHAQIDTHITNDGDLSSTNEIQDLSLSGNTLSLSGDASTVDLSVYALASGSANYVQVSPASAQNGNIWMNGSIKSNSAGINLPDGTFGATLTLVSDGSSQGIRIRANGVDGSAGIQFTDHLVTKQTGKFQLGVDEIMKYYGSFSFENDVNSQSYKLSGVDLFSSLTTGSRTKWDGTKFIDDTDVFAPASGSANYVQVSPASAQVGNIWMDGNIKLNSYYPLVVGTEGLLKIKSIQGPVYNETISLQTSIDNRTDDYDISTYGGNDRHLLTLQPQGGRVLIGTTLTNYVDMLQINGTINGLGYKLSGVDLYSSLTANTLQKWDGTKHISVANSSGYLYNDGTGVMSFTSLPTAVTSISAGDGMNFTTITGTGSVTLGTPTTLTASTTNAVTTTSHTHQITGFLPLTGGTLTGAVTSNNSFTGTNFILSSDKRLKQGIRTLTNTDWVERIKFVRYEMKSNPETERYGVIAQDVEEVNKYLVYTDEHGIKSVSYIDLLIAKIANLEKRVKELENKKKRHER